MPSEYENFPTVTVPKRWVDEVLLALDAAATINLRTMRTDTPLPIAFANHDRLIQEAHDNDWSQYGRARHGTV